MATNVNDLPTPALLVDGRALERNIATMAAARPGPSLRPHVKAFKCTALANRLAGAGHLGFTCATPREIEGMARAGLGDDLLLANEVIGTGAERIGAIVQAGAARVTVAVDSGETIAAAADAGVREVLIDVMVGMPRCGCDPADAGRLADTARGAGLTVRGVMGYEGHLMMEPNATKGERVEGAMVALLAVHSEVGGDVVSAGGTGTYAVNRWCTELQAGSYTLMDTDYRSSGLPFELALSVWTTVISVSERGGWFVLDAGLKAIAMDHGKPSVDRADVWFVSDEHTTCAPVDGDPLPVVGDHRRIWPAHVDPTVAKHERFYVVDGDEVIDEWPIDLRHW